MTKPLNLQERIEAVSTEYEGDYVTINKYVIAKLIQDVCLKCVPMDKDPHQILNAAYGDYAEGWNIANSIMRQNIERLVGMNDE